MQVVNTEVKTELWNRLHSHQKVQSNNTMRDLFKEDPNRFKRFSLQAPHVFLDYSKNRVVEETIDLLIQLADQVGLRTKIEAMFTGEPINTTEGRAVLHTALRNRPNTPVMLDGSDVMPQINAVLSKMRDFTDRVRSGQWKGFTGKAITDVVNIGIGGSDLGPKMVCHALSKYGQDGLRCHFVSNIDGTAVAEILRILNPETTLFIVASKTFTTLETLTNAKTAKSWLVEALHDEAAVAKHFIALSTNAELVSAFGIDTENMFEFWNWVGGRYSVWSAIGMSVALLIGMDRFEEFLEGAHDMDRHFRTADFKENAPVLMALLGIWYRDFFNYGSYAVIPYDHYATLLMSYLQQLDMESNGKSTRLDGSHVDVATGPVIWGGTGTDTQHSFHQLLHQGDTIPIDFLISLESLNPIGNHQVQLFANCLAQSKALMEGKTLEEVRNELKEQGKSESEIDRLAPHKVMPGNRPSNTLVFEKLTPRSLGALIAMYEHKVFVQGVIWGINSFDQWGVELGKQLAKAIAPDLENNPNSPLGRDASTNGLIRLYRKD